MEYPFKPKIGQLVAWEMNGGEFLEKKEQLGVVHEIISEDLVRVIFIKNDWDIILQLENLKLINDVD